MAPQEHAFRSGVDVIVATPGRLLDHFGHPYARLDGLEVLVLDEADRISTWASCPTFAACSGICRRAARRSSSPPPRCYQKPPKRAYVRLLVVELIVEKSRL